ncbi:sarcolemmal membrane-associated protein [Solenopsis invicta]|uniref:sarcolemmal membrane-associated protein n=1 Tax=Solenopsis invicta TaxID=13686 RepID=UPI00193CB3FF|nr:sarcolemmal membrane-associated protein [Solenopsis invicta]
MTELDKCARVLDDTFDVKRSGIHLAPRLDSAATVTVWPPSSPPPSPPQYISLLTVFFFSFSSLPPINGIGTIRFTFVEFALGLLSSSISAMVVASNGGWVQNASSPAGQNNSNLNQNNTQNNINNNNNNNNNHNSSNSSNNNNNNNNGSSSGNKMTAKGVLICRDNSHPFQERTLTLEQPVKIGRSVARARAAPNNAIFDCKVLSRNHALLWYSSGKFYLQDTCSSNGTFVNNQRLSASGLESTPKEVCSGDIVQFGVDVVENTKKVTHGCIVATLKLYLPDGKEAKASLSTSVSSPAGNVSLEDLYKLNQIMQEAQRREKALYSKLGYLQQLVENTRKAANQSWKALITEDRLLSWVMTVESQLTVYSKNYSEDKIRNELAKLQDEKAQYQNAAKEALQKVLQEKLEVTQRLVQLEGRLNETEEECQSLHNIAKYTQTELQELSAKYAEAQKKLQETTDKLAESEERVKDLLLAAEQEKRDLAKRLDDQSKIEKNLRERLHDTRLDSVNIYKQITALRNYAQTLQDMNLKIGDNFDSKGEEDPIEAINAILYKLNSIRINMEVDSEINFYITKTEQESMYNQLKSSDTDDSKELKSDSFTKDQIADSQLTADDSLTEYILPPLSRRTLVNGSLATLDNGDTNGDSDTNSEATDDTCSIMNDDASEKSVIENKKEEEEEGEEEEKKKVKVKEEEEEEEEEELLVDTMEHASKRTSVLNRLAVHYTNAKYQSSETYSEPIKQIAKDDRVTEIPTDEETARVEPEDALDRLDSCKRDQQPPPPDDNNIAPEYEERTEGDYVKTLKPVTKNDTMQQVFHSRDYILQTFIASLDSLRGEDSVEARQLVERELEELKNWLIREPNEIVVDRLKELYYRAKNEAQRMQEVNEELVIVKEKYNAFVEEKAELSKKYMSLKSQCGDLLSATYTVPIHYVAPFAIILVWMLLEKIF